MPTMEGTYLPNPFINTPLIKNLKRGTVHPFGGCCLADSADKGGCNHKGQLFSDESGTEVYVKSSQINLSNHAPACSQCHSDTFIGC